jgi:glycosyltransferase involved in cell wall biosynthesis
MAAADVVCQPSLAEPFGLATLEGLASGRSVVATSIGGPPEFVPEDAGILIDPTDDDSVRAGLDAAAQLPRPNVAARSAAESHDVRRQAERVEELLARAAASRRLGEG